IAIEMYLDELKKRGSSIFYYSKIKEELHDYFHVDEYITKAKSEHFFHGNRPDWKRAENVLDTSEEKVISQRALTRTNSAITFIESKNGIYLPIEEKDYKDLSV